jgi:hypothetical protein
MGVKFQISHNHGLDIPGIFAVYTMTTFLEGTDLFSGKDDDPINWAYMNAYNLAKDDVGRDLPYDVTVSIPAIHFNRMEMFIEDMSKMKMRINQKVCVHLVVFKDFCAYNEYVQSNNCIIHQD